MNITNTIQSTELLWTLVAIPGLLLWVSNRMRAQASLQATKRLDIGNGRRAFARFAVRETTVWAFIEFVFVAIGVVSMTRETNPDANTLSSLVIVAGLILSSAMITALGVEWRRVDRELVRTAVAEMTAAQATREASQTVTTMAQDDREVAQDDREVVQDDREEEQNTRDDNQDLRETGQNTRQTGQDTRDEHQDHRETGQNDRMTGQNDRQTQLDARDELRP